MYRYGEALLQEETVKALCIKSVCHFMYRGETWITSLEAEPHPDKFEDLSGGGGRAEVKL